MSERYVLTNEHEILTEAEFMAKSATKAISATKSSDVMEGLFDGFAFIYGDPRRKPRVSFHAIASDDGEAKAIYGIVLTPWGLRFAASLEPSDENPHGEWKPIPLGIGG